MTVPHIGSSGFEESVLRSDVPVVVDFFADWCGPCHQLSPTIEALAEKWGDAVRFAKVDIEANPDLAVTYRISSIPAVLLFENGRPQAWSLGAKPGYLLEKELGLTKRQKKAGATTRSGMLSFFKRKGPST